MIDVSRGLVVISRFSEKVAPDAAQRRSLLR